MTATSDSTALQQPLDVWNDLAQTTGEMLAASAEVIGHRTNRMALAGPLPTTRDQQEFALMGQEKVDAAARSATAMGAQMLSVGADIGLRAWRDLCTTASATFALAASRTPQQSADAQADLTRTLTESAASLAEIGSAGARIARHGLKPIHAVATANARRLAAG